MTDEFKELRATLAAGPTPGPWHWDMQPEYKCITLFGRRRDVVMDFARWGMDRASPRFACKNTPLKILYRPADRIDWVSGNAVVQEDAAYIAAANPQTIAALLDDLDAARAEIEGLRADAARYRWLRHGCDERWSRATHIAANYYGSEWDAAIDAAMKGE